MRIIFSRDRAAQLDLLLTSLERHAEPEDTAIIYRATSPAFAQAYQQVWKEHREHGYWLLTELGGTFQRLVRREIATTDEFLTFLCDDDVLYDRPTPGLPEAVLFAGDDVLTFSLRLGQNTRVQYPTGATNTAAAQPSGLWQWAHASGDFGYPGSIDGHIFRTADVRRMLDSKRFANPTALELALVAGCNELADDRPLMACYPHSVLVGVPVNRVSEQSGVRHGGSLLYSAENLNDSFLAGMRLDLDNTDWSGVNGAHTEVDLRWRVPVGSVA